MKKYILKHISIWIIKYLQKKYKTISIENKYNHKTIIVNKLILIQSILYFFKVSFQPYGYFHKNCDYTREDKIFFDKLFPMKTFYELDVVVEYNPEAVIFYKNEISMERSVFIKKLIEKQLKQLKRWN